ncbi:hypothetical protein PRZ48_014838 [Zasmidium cellare]|uniref:Transmembrane protein n=1 Tax=Zasmidium cellare TaxID=395010 RepID=A0ABR0DWT8_ZASCE|nr:hypothetical protein PRZ48_014838 [Zasmidium cellare]
MSLPDLTPPPNSSNSTGPPYHNNDDKPVYIMFSILLAMVGIITLATWDCNRRSKKARRLEQNTPATTRRQPEPQPVGVELLPRYQEPEVPPPAYSAGRERIFCNFQPLAEIYFTQPTNTGGQNFKRQQSFTPINSMNLITAITIDAHLLFLWTLFLLGKDLLEFCRIVWVGQARRHRVSVYVVGFRRSSMRRWKRTFFRHCALLVACWARTLVMWLATKKEDDEVLKSRDGLVIQRW